MWVLYCFVLRTGRDREEGMRKRRLGLDLSALGADDLGLGHFSWRVGAVSVSCLWDVLLGVRCWGSLFGGSLFLSESADGGWVFPVVIGD